MSKIKQIKVAAQPTLSDLGGIPLPMGLTKRVQSEFDLDNTFEGYYFKDGGQRPFPQLISGLPLPLDADGVCRNRTFIRCDFHPVCGAVKFENCTFIDCQNPNIEWKPL